MKWFVLALIIFILAGLAVFRSNLFIINSAAVQIEKIQCADQNQISNSSGIPGQNFFLLNSAKIENDLKGKYICIRKVEISRYFPNKVKLFVSGREAAAILIASAEASPSAEASSSAQKLVVDNEGVIYSNDFEHIDAPLIFVSGLDLSLGQKVQDNLIGKALKILEKVNSFGINIKETKIYSDVLFLTGEGIQVFFKLSDNIDTQLASLQLILDKAKIDEDTLDFVDLRFDKPVVKIAPKKH